ncbi:MAG: hypothetical protein ACOCX1_03240 [Fimbriimonadaceae bacterium]
MSALRKEHTPDEETAGQVVYLHPATLAGPRHQNPLIKRLLAGFRDWWRDADIWQTMGLQIKVTLVVLALGPGLLSLAKYLYEVKTEAGIDLVPGVHGPDVLPFLE